MALSAPAGPSQNEEEEKKEGKESDVDGDVDVARGEEEMKRKEKEEEDVEVEEIHYYGDNKIYGKVINRRTDVRDRVRVPLLIVPKK